MSDYRKRLEQTFGARTEDMPTALKPVGAVADLLSQGRRKPTARPYNDRDELFQRLRDLEARANALQMQEGGEDMEQFQVGPRTQVSVPQGFQGEIGAGEGGMSLGRPTAPSGMMYEDEEMDKMELIRRLLGIG